MATPTNYTFHWADYLVCCLSIIISMAIGIYFACAGGKQKTTEEFLLADRNGEFTGDQWIPLTNSQWRRKRFHAIAPTWTCLSTARIIPVAFSISVSVMNAAFILGTVLEVHFYGTLWVTIGIGWCLYTVVSAHLFVPIYRRVEFASIYEYLERRFNYCVRVLATILFTIEMLVFLSVVIYVPALAFNAVVGISSLDATIIIVGVAAVFYTTIGGIKAVIWTDAFQTCIMLVGLLVLIVMGTHVAGGISEVWRLADEGGRLKWVEWDIDPRVRHTTWGLVIGATILGLTLTGSNQLIVQRLLILPTTKDAQITLYLSIAVQITFLIIITCLGVVIYAYYHDCDPILTGQIKKPNQLLLLFMMEILGKYHGLPGLFAASVAAAALSTVSSIINSSSTVVLEDLIKPAFASRHADLSDSKATWIAKGLGLLFGLIAIGLAYLSPLFEGILVQLTFSIVGSLGGPLLGLFVLGIFFPFTNSIGAFVATVFSAVLALWMNLGAILYGKRQRPLHRSTAGCRIMETGNASTPIITTMYSDTTILSTTDGLSTTAATLSHTPNHMGSGLSEFYNVSYIWLALFAVIISLVVGIITSLITGCRRGQPPVDRKMMVLLGDSCSCMPFKVRKVLNFGLPPVDKTSPQDDIKIMSYTKHDEDQPYGVDNPSNYTTESEKY